MKRLSVAPVLALVLMSGLLAIAYAQAPDQRNDQPRDQSSHPQQAAHPPQAQQKRSEPAPRSSTEARRSAPAPRQSTAARRAGPAPRQSAPARGHVQQARSAAQVRTQQGQQRNVWQQRRAGGNLVARNWQQRGGYHGTRIPAPFFSAHFGPAHVFHAYQMPFMVVGGYPRLQYGGYWFSIVDPIPVWWGPDWYQNDNIYFAWVDGGYYMYDAAYPGRPGVAVSVAF